MIYHTLDEVIAEPMFARADLALRRGRHISPDYDTGLFDFVSGASKLMERFYRYFDVSLMQGNEGYYYLLPDRLATPPPLGLRKLTVMEMLTGQTLALMRLDHKWLEANHRIPDLAIFGLLEQLLGEQGMVRLAGRRRGKDQGQDARKLREAFAAALRTLERLGFIRREGRGELGVVIPLVAVMRFAEPVRGAEELDVALTRLISEGQIKEDDDDVDPDAGAEG